jgi:hypothetical protein
MRTLTHIIAIGALSFPISAEASEKLSAALSVCKSYDVFEKAIVMGVSGDRPAMDKWLSDNLTSGQCRSIKKDTDVFVDRLSPGIGLTIYVRVRERGEYTEWWAIKDHIKSAN